jgi:hypothetical protein
LTRPTPTLLFEIDNDLTFYRHMADEILKELADRRFAEALRATGGRDPRDFYRARLREIRGRDEGAFREARAYFEGVLVPGVSREGSDPMGEWLDYGCFLANLLEPGSAVQIDRSGRSRPYRKPVPVDHLVLHLPTSGRERALAVGLPPELSEAQRATYRLLVRVGDESQGFLPSPGHTGE